MSKLDVIRAWKDEEYCESLSASDRSLLPQNPAGIVELTDLEMGQAEGGTHITIVPDSFVITQCLSLATCTALCPITIANDAGLLNS